MTSLTQERKQEIVSKFGDNDQDTGNTRVQIALLTARINDLTEHLRANKKDHHSRRAEQTIAVQQRLTDSILDARDSVSGVSMDEEMANLIRFQTAYGGAARAVTAMDEMLETLVSRTGKVGL